MQLFDDILYLAINRNNAVELEISLVWLVYGLQRGLYKVRKHPVNAISLRYKW